MTSQPAAHIEDEYYREPWFHMEIAWRQISRKAADSIMKFYRIMRMGRAIARAIARMLPVHRHSRPQSVKPKKHNIKNAVNLEYFIWQRAP